ncbi:uncharacterized protein LY89DRAFT_785354 [Mollisia scopiformis]|uniref:Uncharacterized protein n=1 Tax=Mollisia scopiformis TaxID=149040 RepID=A0A194WYV2_MOLSC|nr:uncharacterized protein LY89DRAFT_785354 [Mollisia scopiformis]KUJ12772.1 hypothetical protein LY89DRAFT_785354 [Mollisia scopiformis]
MNANAIFKAYVGPCARNSPDFWLKDVQTATKKTPNAHIVLKNKELAITALETERKFQSQQANTLANLKAKKAHHAILQQKEMQKFTKKFQRLQKAMWLAEAGGIPKGFEEYPLYGGGDDEVTEAIKDKLHKDLLAINLAVEKTKAVAAEIEKSIKFASKKITIR